MDNSPESQQFRKNMPELVKIIGQGKYASAAGILLYREEIIDDDNLARAMNMNNDSYERAENLTKEIIQSIISNPANFEKIGRALANIECPQSQIDKIKEIFTLKEEVEGQEQQGEENALLAGGLSLSSRSLLHISFHTASTVF